MSSSNNSGENFWGVVILIGAVILGAMWLFDAGPFEKSYTPTPTYYNNYGGGSQPSFTGNKYDCEGGCLCPRYAKKSTFNSDCKNCDHPQDWHYSQK